MRKTAFKAVCILCLIAYLILLTRVIVFKYPDTMTYDILSSWSVDRLVMNSIAINLIPFKTISTSLFYSTLSVEIPTLIYNIIAFMPLGFLLPFITEKTRQWRRIVLIGLIVSFIFEFVQWITMLGTADVDDMLLNVLGTALGYGVYKGAAAVYRKVGNSVVTRDNAARNASL